MGRKSFTQELKERARVSEGMDAGGCWRDVLEFEHAAAEVRWNMESPRSDNRRRRGRGRRRREQRIAAA